MDWMLNPRLRQPLRTCLDDEPEAMQTMYFYKGSEQRRHQDAYHLPGCMSAWIALQDVDERNGSIHVQLGSHRGPILDKKDFKEDEDGKPGPWYGWNHEDAFDALFERNGFPEIAVEANKGDTVALPRQIDSSRWPHSGTGLFPPRFSVPLPPLQF